MEAVGNAQTTDNVRSAAGGQDILSHGQSRMPTDDAENHIVTRTIADVHGQHGELYIITRTIADIHGQHGELYCHTDNHGCPQTIII